MHACNCVLQFIAIHDPIVVAFGIAPPCKTRQVPHAPVDVNEWQYLRRGMQAFYARAFAVASRAAYSEPGTSEVEPRQDERECDTEQESG
jgi:hypothetical protein